MRKIILSTMMAFLLRKITVLSFALLFLCSSSCASQEDNVEIDPIVGKWKLVKTIVPRKPSITYSTVEVILEFKPGNTLTTQCLRQDNNCSPWNSGNYPYSYMDDLGGTRMRIGNRDWWYRISEKGLMIGQGPVDGLSYYFERIESRSHK